jgi:hypothetical protein
VPVPAASAESPPEASEPLDAESDKQAPVLGFVVFEPQEVQAGGHARVIAHVQDDLSGIRSISGTIVSPSLAGQVSFGAGRETTPGVFEGSILVPETAEEGVWFIRQLTLEDKARNRTAFSYSDSANSAATLMVRNSDGDSRPPELIDVRFDQPFVEPGSKNRIMLQITDDRSGVATVGGAVVNAAGTASLPFGATALEASDLWTAELQIPQSADCGEWKVQHIIARDKASNRGFFKLDHPAIARAGFSVAFGPGCDADPPRVSYLAFEPAFADNSTEQTITIRATIDDPSGVANAYGRIQGELNAEGKRPGIGFSMKDAGNGTWSAKFTLPRHATRGLWTVDYLQTEDKGGNRKAYRLDNPVIAAAVLNVQ